MKKTELRRILANMRVSIPKEVENELLEQYGNYATDPPLAGSGRHGRCL